MRRTALIALLGIGTVVGFGSGFASVRRHAYERAQWGSCDRWRGEGYSRWSPAAAPVAPAAPAAAPVVVNTVPAAPAAAPVVASPAPSTTVILIGGALPQAPQVVTVPAAPAAPAH